MGIAIQGLFVHFTIIAISLHHVRCQGPPFRYPNGDFRCRILNGGEASRVCIRFDYCTQQNTGHFLFFQQICGWDNANFYPMRMICCPTHSISGHIRESIGVDTQDDSYSEDVESATFIEELEYNERETEALVTTESEFTTSEYVDSGDTTISWQIEDSINSATSLGPEYDLTTRSPAVVLSNKDGNLFYPDCGCRHRNKSESCPLRTAPEAFAELLVIEGRPVEIPGDYPWMALLGMAGTDGKIFWFCGGTLITNQHVMSAAHCFQVESPQVIKLGAHDLASSEEHAMDFTPAEISIHEGYQPPKLHHDIAIVRLKEEVRFTEFIRPACLPFAVEPKLPARKILVMGWGQISTATKETALVLQEAELPIAPRKKCNDTYMSLKNFRNNILPHGVDDFIICAGGTGVDTCQGDSGGPLIREDRNRGGNLQYSVIGVVSAGHGCGLKEYPGLYTRVDKYLDWIVGILTK